jgi:hypothetical protein
MCGTLGLRCRGLGWQRRRFPDRVGKGKEVVRARLLRGGGHRQAKNFPATGNRQRAGVLLAQIVAMRLGVGG